jgi:hypothetical protein
LVVIVCRFTQPAERVHSLERRVPEANRFRIPALFTAICSAKAKMTNGLPTAVLVDIGDDGASACSAELMSDFAPDPATSAGHDGNLVLQQMLSSPLGVSWWRQVLARHGRDAALAGRPCNSMATS